MRMCLPDQFSAAPAAARWRVGGRGIIIPRGFRRARLRGARRSLCAVGRMARTLPPPFPLLPRIPETFPMHYEEQARRLGILGGFALGIALGAGVGLLMGGR